MLGLILAAANLLAGGAKAVQANQERQRQKGIIGRAYDIAGQRLALQQTHVRQGTSEAFGARGLTAGGPSGAGAPHTLGEQGMADLSREQELETKDLAARRSAAYSDVKAGANAAIAGGITEGITGAISGYQTGKMAEEGGGGGAPIRAAYGKGVMVDSPPPVAPSSYPGAWGGIDPIDPLGRGAWKSPGTTGGFNVYSDKGLA